MRQWVVVPTLAQSCSQKGDGCIRHKNIESTPVLNKSDEGSKKVLCMHFVFIDDSDDSQKSTRRSDEQCANRRCAHLTTHWRGAVTIRESLITFAKNHAADVIRRTRNRFSLPLLLHSAMKLFVEEIECQKNNCMHDGEQGAIAKCRPPRAGSHRACGAY